MGFWGERKSYEVVRIVGKGEVKEGKLGARKMTDVGGETPGDYLGGKREGGKTSWKGILLGKKRGRRCRRQPFPMARLKRDASGQLGEGTALKGGGGTKKKKEEKNREGWDEKTHSINTT